MFAAVFGVILTLAGIIFNIHVKRVDKIEIVQRILVKRITRIATDIRWIKQKLNE